MSVKILRPKGRKNWYLSISYRGMRELTVVGTREAAYIAKPNVEASEAAGTFRFRKEKDAAEEKVAVEKMTFREVVARWQKEYVELKTKPSTQVFYANLLKGFLLPSFGDREVAAITRADVKVAVASWKEDREKTPVEKVKEDSPENKSRRGKRKRKPGEGIRTIPAALRTLRAILSWCFEEGIVETNVCTKPSRIFKVDEPAMKDFLRPEEVGIYLDAMKAKNPRHHPLFRTLIFTGMRIGEAIALTWADIDWNGKLATIQRASWKGHISTPKNGKARRVDLSPEMIEVLKDHRRNLAAEALKAGKPLAELCFPSADGTMMDDGNLRKAHTTALKEAGLRHLKIHSLRSTFASLLVSAGVPIYHVARALGHADVATTAKHYADLAPGEGKEMVNVLERFVFGDPAGKHANGTRTE